MASFESAEGKKNKNWQWNAFKENVEKFGLDVRQLCKRVNNEENFNIFLRETISERSFDNFCSEFVQEAPGHAKFNSVMTLLKVLGFILRDQNREKYPEENYEFVAGMHRLWYIFELRLVLSSLRVLFKDHDKGK